MESDDNFDEDLTEAGGSLVANEEMGQIRENIQQKIDEFNLAVSSNPLLSILFISGAPFKFFYFTRYLFHY